MRKILCGLMALVFVLTMASCGSASQEASSSGESSGPLKGGKGDRQRG